MVLLTIFTRVIDLGQELVLKRELGMPATYADIFSILRKAGVINNKLFLELKELVRLRNKFSHEYFTFTEKDVFEGMKKISAVKKILRLLRAK